ncbi:adenylate/guanylate cyclase domain-containing protein [Microbacterium sp. CFBP 8794]|uniref:adenylate/guanylate cyclase domain-containing protein n=1 Tax=Microbacterium sp. CFBP 8794 TaxID=2775269 RepID=UPI0017852773|nr:adenylate/guanylate cyclase domain-containing protein [Microbacterium sp. CFBP 8794]MBD8479762.1 adenylate/guanylate cyclase domain-containing protein [Microbacterium sp. CFBP 8794]
MTLGEELKAYAAKTHSTAWTRRNGQKVPEAEDVALGNVAVDIDAVVLYADLKDSTGLVKGWKDWFAAAVYKNYLYTVSRIIRHHGGAITAFDGDRVMAVFIGDGKEGTAAKVALKINWAVKNILQPAIEAQYKGIAFKLEQKVGIATSKTMVARTGIRGSNDLVWVGNAANIAAKLAALDKGYPSYITSEVFNALPNDAKFATDNRPMWRDLGNGDGYGKIYGSTFWWPVV